MMRISKILTPKAWILLEIKKEKEIKSHQQARQRIS
jgi:hypothetical protein